MDKAKTRRVRRQRAHLRIRKKVWGTAERPRMSVYKSTRYIYAQLIDDDAGHTLAQAVVASPSARRSSHRSHLMA